MADPYVSGSNDSFEGEELTFEEMFELVTRYEEIELESAPWLSDILDQIEESYRDDIDENISALDRGTADLRRMLHFNGLDIHNPSTARALVMGFIFSGNFIANSTPDPDEYVIQAISEIRMLSHSLREFTQS